MKTKFDFVVSGKKDILDNLQTHATLIQKFTDGSLFNITNVSRSEDKAQLFVRIEVFDRYRLAVQRSEQAPILLFNEADGIIGIRREGATSAVDKMVNSIQNIILQEMENLDGILIATTNLTQNLDPAFERRFLYKICFEKPDASVREKIWHTMLPALSESECTALASAYDLSGGQMENVARKFSINAILYGGEKSPMDILHAYCNAERLDNHTIRRIGF